VYTTFGRYIGILATSDPGPWPSRFGQHCYRQDLSISLQFGVSLSRHQAFGHLNK